MLGVHVDRTELCRVWVHRKLTGDGYAKGFDVGNSLNVRGKVGGSTANVPRLPRALKMFCSGLI